MIARKGWADFQRTGLLLIINQILHVFGWAIVLEMEDQKIVSAYPARVKFRGFDNESVTESYRKVSAYLKDNIDEIKQEADT